MTREEAREALSVLKIYDNQWLREAIDMAIEALSAEEAVWNEYEAEFTDLPDVPRYYYEKVVGKMAHEINMLKEQLESADAVQGEWIDRSNGGRIKYPWWESCECNQCGEYGSGAYNYCPNCGARMEANE